MPVTYPIGSIIDQGQGKRIVTGTDSGGKPILGDAPPTGSGTTGNQGQTQAQASDPNKTYTPGTPGYTPDPTYAARNPSIAGTPLPPPGGSPSDIVNSTLARFKNETSLTQDQLIAQREQQTSGLIDAITKRFDDMVSAQNKIGDENKAEAGALAVRSGLMGSPSGVSMVSAEEQKNQDAINAINDKRGAAIAQLYADTKASAQTEYQNTVANANADAKSLLDFYSAQADKAQKNIVSVADFEALKNTDPQAYQQMLDQAGWTDNVARGNWLSAHQSQIIGTDPVVTSDGSKATWFTRDPQTGNVIPHSIDLPTNMQSVTGLKIITLKNPDGSTYAGVVGVGPDGKPTINKLGDNSQNTASNAGSTPSIVPTGTNVSGSTPSKTGINIYGIKSTSTTQGYGGTDSGVSATDGGTFIASQGDSADRAVAQKLLTSDIYKNLTVDAAMKLWSNNGYGAEVAPLVINPNAKISQLSPEEIGSILDGIKQAEGIQNKQSTAATDPKVQSWAQNILSGNATIGQVPNTGADYGMRDKVSEALAGQGKQSYSPLAASRFSMASNRILSNYIQLPQYQLTANGLPYLQRIDAAMKTPGSISDQDLLDSLTKLNTSGNAISDAQVALITNGQSFADMANVLGNKLKNGGVLSDSQRQQIQTIAKAIYSNYKKGYQPVYDKATQQLSDAGIPQAFWTMPDLNSLSALSGSSGQTDTAANASTDYGPGDIISVDGNQYVVGSDGQTLTPQ